jgi:hypothetical protein
MRINDRLSIGLTHIEKRASLSVDTDEMLPFATR